MKTAPPESEIELLARAQSLAGLPLAALAEKAGLEVPKHLLHHKGWSGQLLEMHLGTTAKSKPEPDFLELGIELKTIPLNRHGAPSESTFVSTAHLLDIGRLTWETSTVRKKLARVLWIPIEAERTIPIAKRRIGTPILWSPNPEEESILKSDWEELSDMICMGQLSQITARIGTYLQIRPKGANAKSLSWGIGENRERIQTLPRCF